MSSTSHRRRRVITTGVLCLALAGGAAAVISARRSKEASTTAAAPIFKTATVSRGDLTTKESVDGSVTLSSTLTVLHRIEGQTSSSSTSPTPVTTPTTQQPANGATTPTGSSSAALLATATEAPVVDCSTTTVAISPPSTTQVPAETTPATSTPETTSTTTSTTVAPVEPSPPVTTPAVEPCATAPTTTVAVPSAAGGGAVPTGGGTRTGASGAASSGAGSTAASARVTQTVTSIIATNTAIQQGEVLYTVDGAPIVALDGALPAWRSLSTSSDDGVDIVQLETSLIGLGYDPDQKVTVDEHFDSATRAMVKAWQIGLGVEATGSVTLGSVVFLPSSTTVSSVARSVGDTVGDGDTVLTLATPSQEVLIDVPTGDEAQVVPGLSVGIGNVQGTVSRLRSANRNGAVVVEAVIAPAAPIEKVTNGSSVKVTLTLQNQAGVLIAPAEALVSKLDGTYAVQLQTSDDTTKWLTVELLGVSGGNIAIRGTDLTEGTVLLLPV